MIKKVMIVSLSRGIIGESFVKHEVDIGIKRLEEFGLEVVFSENALKGIDYITEHPEKRARDLIDAFSDPTVDMILCAIGGDDTYRLLPYLFENNELKNTVTDKIFLGFSDTTINHLMLHKVGLKTFYGQSFLADICELENRMLPYSEKYFTELISTGKISDIRPSDLWYEERTSFDESAIGQKRVFHKNGGFTLLQGAPIFSGKILGGCIDSMYDIFVNERYSDTADLCKKYQLFPNADDWKGRILLLETSEERMSPEKYRRALLFLKTAGVFDAVSGIIVGKPMNEYYTDEYNQILKETVADSNMPIVTNISVGHAYPHCIIPFGVDATVDVEKQIIKFSY